VRRSLSREQGRSLSGNAKRKKRKLIVKSQVGGESGFSEPVDNHKKKQLPTRGLGGGTAEVPMNTVGTLEGGEDWCTKPREN